MRGFLVKDGVVFNLCCSVDFDGICSCGCV
jgi:hypothetical protein